MQTPSTKQTAKPWDGKCTKVITIKWALSPDSVPENPDLNSGGPREGGCVEGLSDHAPLGRISAVGVSRLIGEYGGRGREESLNLVHVLVEKAK